MLGKELRELREKRRRTTEEPSAFTAEAVSTKLGFSRSKLSRVEAGEIPLPKLADLEALLDHYEVNDRTDREQLLEMQRNSLKWEPLTSYRPHLPSGLPRYIGLERESTAIRGYERAVVHGLLQHEDYARALMESAKVIEERTTESMEKSLAARMERKALLDGRQVHIIMTEACLRTVVGSPDVMRRQYAEIVRLYEELDVETQIIPEDLPAYRAGFNFTCLEFDELDPVVQSDSQGATTMWSKRSDIGQYQRQFNAMAKAAPGPSETPRILHDLEKKLWTT
ncbi:helix-turn-helix transcriptional regulator [Streptomyces sp. NPDC001941]|uniref:helix-turn-helix domain-containing protein n=1 Tax=Streptomyces sp. NPDC001941 TaxID=3154659 RepID=UPI0033223EC2